MAGIAEADTIFNVVEIFNLELVSSACRIVMSGSIG
jgi:hypothetical protein